MYDWYQCIMVDTFSVNSVGIKSSHYIVSSCTDLPIRSWSIWVMYYI